MRALPAEGDARLDVPEAAGVEDAVRRLEHDGKVDVGHEIGGEERRQRAVDDRDLLAREEEVAPGRTGACQLDHHSDARLHVARAEPVHGAVGDPAGDVPLGGNRVEVARQEDRPVAVEQHFAVVVERRPRHELADEGHDPRFRAALGGHVDELERPGCEIGSRHGRRHNDLQMAVRQPDPTPGLEPERGFVLAVLAQGVDPDGELAELEELARTAGVEPVARLVQHRPHPDPRTYVGKGKLGELKESYGNANAEVLIVDDELSPSQQRLLENELQARVVDRAELILDIFAQHAVTAEGKLQVELAQLEYNLPRMRGMWQHLERLGGGLGTRGPGESQLETDRRLARRRVSLLKDRLNELGRQRDVRRKERQRHADPDGRARRLHQCRQVDAPERADRRRRCRCATACSRRSTRRRAGSSTTDAATSSPTRSASCAACRINSSRALRRRSRRRSSRTSSCTSSTARSPEDKLIEQIAAVDSVLHEIGADELPIQLVINKIDAVDDAAATPPLEPLPRTRCRYRPSWAKGWTTCAPGSPNDSPSATNRFASSFPYEDGGQA